MDLIVNILLGIIVAATPLVFAAIGELVVEAHGSGKQNEHDEDHPRQLIAE